MFYPHNQKLSESRVAAVKTWLTGKGIAADRLTAKGYADTMPLVPNDSPQNSARNRRVELRKLDCRSDLRAGQRGSPSPHEVRLPARTGARTARGRGYPGPL